MESPCNDISLAISMALDVKATYRNYTSSIIWVHSGNYQPLPSGGEVLFPATIIICGISNSSTGMPPRLNYSLSGTAGSDSQLIFLGPMNLTMMNLIVIGTPTNRGGVVLLPFENVNPLSLTIHHCQFTQWSLISTAIGNGAAISAYRLSSLLIESSIFHHNDIKVAEGSRASLITVDMLASTNVTVKHSLWYSNSVIGGRAAGMMVTGAAHVDLQNVTMNHNHIQHNQFDNHDDNCIIYGTFVVTNQTLDDNGHNSIIIQQSSIINNTVTIVFKSGNDDDDDDDDGRAIRLVSGAISLHVANVSFIEISDTIFEENIITSPYDTVYAVGSGLAILTPSVFRYGSKETDLATITNGAAHAIDLIRCLFHRNGVRGGQIVAGGAYIIAGANVTMNDTIFTHNDVQSRGGGPYASSVGGATSLVCVRGFDASSDQLFKCSINIHSSHWSHNSISFNQQSTLATVQSTLLLRLSPFLLPSLSISLALSHNVINV
jgi:hypothetical protein